MNFLLINTYTFLVISAFTYYEIYINFIIFAFFKNNFCFYIFIHDFKSIIKFNYEQN